jgi:hypothetical protein
MIYLIIYLLPILIFITIRWFQAEPGSSVKDLFSAPECKECKYKDCKNCLLCEHKEDNECLLGFMFVPIINILALLTWLLIILISYIPIKKLWDKFINYKVK